MEKLLTAILLSGALIDTNAFSIRTNPPISILGFTCQCTTSICDCRQGNINISVIPVKEYYVPDKDIFGNKVCAEKCLAKIGNVVSVSYPYIQMSEMKAAERSIAQSIKNNMTTQQKFSLVISSLKEKAGDIPFIGKFLQDDEGDKLGDISTEKIKSITKEKSVNNMEKRARQMNVDMSAYVLIKTAKLWFLKNNDNNIGLLEPVIHTVNKINEIQMQGKMMKFYEYFLLIDNFPEIAEILPFDVYASGEDKIGFLYRQRKCISSLLKGFSCNDKYIGLLLSEIMSGRNPIFLSGAKNVEIDKNILSKQIERIDKVLVNNQIKKVLE